MPAWVEDESASCISSDEVPMRKKQRTNYVSCEQTALGELIRSLSNGRLVLRSRDDCGRYVVAKDHFGAGELIFKEKPFCICDLGVCVPQ